MLIPIKGSIDGYIYTLIDYKMKFKHLLYTLLLCFLMAFNALAQSEKGFINGHNAFAFNLFRKLYSPKENVFFSPYSIRTALAMTYAGAKNQTKKQMMDVLYFDTNQLKTHQTFLDFSKKIKAINADSVTKISIANALWKKENYTFKKDYLQLINKYYGASLFPLPTNAKPINNWVSKKTNGKINQLISDKDINAFTRLILTNAIYFKGEWQNSFRKEDTKKEVFKTPMGEGVNVDMMYRRGDVNYYEDEEKQAIKLPYKDGSMVMTLILPAENSSIEKLSNKLNDSVLANLNYLEKQVEIYVPKFKFTAKYQLGDVLSSMGMPDAFDNKADFTGMAGGSSLIIDKVIHKAFVEVNEKGTEAAAATAIMMRMTSCLGCREPKKLVFKADHPFLAIITESKTGNILFMGAVMNPNKE